MKLTNRVVNKIWGQEIWFDNNTLYCGKLLTVNPNKWSSSGNFHYHKNKTETFFIIEGILRLDIAHNNNGEYDSINLFLNGSYRVMPWVKHRFTSAIQTPCKFIEVSTNHQDSDSYRCYWDKKQMIWKEYG